MNHRSSKLSTIILTMLFCTSVWAQSVETPKPSAEEAAETPVLKITNKEVAAVQAELQRRGYYRNTPNGLLDGETREAIKTYQKENEQEETGRIDMKLLNSLELQYPATGKEVESARKKGLIPRIGYGAKDTVTGARDTTINTGKSVRRGAEKTKDKTVELAQDAGDATVKGAKKAGNKTVDTTARAGRRVSDVFVGRSDADLQRDIRDVLESKEETARVRSEVKDGVVKLFPKEGVDVSDAVSGIRKVSGVRSVMVIAK